MTHTRLPETGSQERKGSLFERYPRLYTFCRDHGFYARRLSGTFDRPRVVGVDRSARLLARRCGASPA